MRYAKWSLSFATDPRHGAGPEEEVASRGTTMTGIFSLTPSDPYIIVGYVDGESSLDDLDEWQVQEITAQEFLDAAQKLDPNITLREDGTLQYPPREDEFA